jgi:hypothetical protein
MTYKYFISDPFKFFLEILPKYSIDISPPKSAFIPFVCFCDLDNNTFKGLTSLLSVEQEIQYDEHT